MDEVELVNRNLQVGGGGAGGRLSADCDWCSELGGTDCVTARADSPVSITTADTDIYPSLMAGQRQLRH